MPHLLPEIDNDRNATDDVNYGKQDHASRCDFFEVQFHIEKYWGQI
jgi:hypothetical protein